MQKIEPVIFHHLPSEPPVQKARLPWRSFLEDPVKKQAQEAALCVAERMRDPTYVKAIAEVAKKQSLYPP